MNGWAFLALFCGMFIGVPIGMLIWIFKNNPWDNF